MIQKLLIYTLLFPHSLFSFLKIYSCSIHSPSSIFYLQCRIPFHRYITFYLSIPLMKGIWADFFFCILNSAKRKFLSAFVNMFSRELHRQNYWVYDCAFVVLPSTAKLYSKINFTNLYSHQEIMRIPILHSPTSTFYCQIFFCCYWQTDRWIRVSVSPFTSQ